MNLKSISEENNAEISILSDTITSSSDIDRCRILGSVRNLYSIKGDNCIRNLPVHLHFFRALIKIH